MKLIIGLGNPGNEYNNTRHNIGFDAIDIYLKKHSISLDKSKFKSIYYKGKINGNDIIIMKPLTYMNLSGEALIQFINFYKIHIEDIIVIYDDMSLPLGSYKIKQKGSSAGQNGINNIIKHLRTDSFPRIKLGISNNPQIQKADYVLGKFSKEERLTIDIMLQDIPSILDEFIKSDIFNLMNIYNNKGKK